MPATGMRATLVLAMEAAFANNFRRKATRSPSAACAW
jgi:hypothetical protein